MTGVVLWTLFVAIVAGLLGFLACALVVAGDRADEWADAESIERHETVRRELGRCQR